MSTISQDYLDDLIATLRKYGNDPNLSDYNPHLRNSYVVAHMQLYARKGSMTDAELGAEVRLLLTALEAAKGADEGDVPRGV